MSTTQTDPGTPANTPSPSATPSTPKGARKSRVKRTNPLTARRFFDPVVLALGELTKFTAGTAVPMKDVQDLVLESFTFTEADRTAVEATNKDGEDAQTFLDNFARRRIQFAFRNRRANSDGTKSTVYLKNGQALTTQLGVGQWGLTDAGVAKARELAGASTDAVPTAPETKEPAEETVEPVEATSSELETADLPPEMGSEDHTPPDPEPEVVPVRRGRRRGLSG